MAADVYVPTQLLGSTDWTGGVAPAGGTHTGTATIIMWDGSQFVVAHDRAEVLRKMDIHGIAQTMPQWVGFDQPLTAVPVVLNVGNIASVI